jgi:hypothetical protein
MSALSMLITLIQSPSSRLLSLTPQILLIHKSSNSQSAMTWPHVDQLGRDVRHSAHDLENGLTASSSNVQHGMENGAQMIGAGLDGVGSATQAGASVLGRAAQGAAGIGERRAY